MAPKKLPRSGRRDDYSKATKMELGSQALNSAVDSVGPECPPGSTQNCLSLNSRQGVLDVFSSAFPDIFNDKLPSKIQTLKGHLYNRRFEEAFADSSLLEAYAVRWSPTRALAYADVFLNLLDIGEWAESIRKKGAIQDTKSLEVGHIGQAPSPPLSENCVEPARARSQSTLKLATSAEGSYQIVCIGAGGGAELMGLTAALMHLFPEMAPAFSPAMDVTLVDNGPWGPVLQSLMLHAGNLHCKNSLDEVPVTPAIPYGLGYNFMQLDVLSSEALSSLTSTLEICKLATIAFTLNELLTSSRAKTTLFFLQLTDLLPIGALLLIIDSPGSYSTVTYTSKATDNEGIKAKTEQKNYPMVWLLERVLFTECKSEEGEQRWGKVRGEESKWFRLDEALQYPMKLEDMRYQMHLYRRV